MRFFDTDMMFLRQKPGVFGGEDRPIGQRVLVTKKFDVGR